MKITIESHRRVGMELLLSLFAAFVSAPLWAQPTISGVAGSIENGAEATIQGSGFGLKATPGPLVWDDFESGQDGSLIAGNAPAVSNISETWKWADHGQISENRPRYSIEEPRPNSSTSSRHSFPANSGGYNSSLEIRRAFQNSGDEVYFTYWWNYRRSGTNWSRNLKPWIEYGSDGTMPMAYIGWGNPSQGDGGLRNSVQDTNLNGLRTLWGGAGIDRIESEWIRIEVYLRQSSPSGDDGAFQTWLHRSNSPSISLAHGNTGYRTRNSSNHWLQWHFGSYHSTSNDAGGVVLIDDLYFDNSRARVELGDAPIWDECSRREIQITSTWSPDTVVVTLRAGSFKLGDNAYLFVVDENGNASAGHPVVIGGASAGAPQPAPPRDVTAR